uniref:1-phosphatidylinositol 3-phosphate 5-kinase (inferred by orthology to a human protein) n=1 Tax=Anisakis simplex TaxID=6269 RepID=A0A0M3JA52_ANISI
LSKQVERILAQRPSVVVVEENVARLAVYQLLKAGVSLVSNIKTKVLHRVARSTHADVMPSLDAQLLQQKIGFCPMFSQCKIRLASGKTKTLLIFSECSPDLGCSVLLRGQSMRELRAAKRILRYMILALYSANLELKLLKLFNSSIGARSSDCYVCSLNSDEVDPNPVDFSSVTRQFNFAILECTLTASPLINFGVPFLETAKGRECVLRPYFKHPLYHFLSKSDLQAVKYEIYVWFRYQYQYSYLICNDNIYGLEGSRLCFDMINLWVEVWKQFVPLWLY